MDALLASVSSELLKSALKRYFEGTEHMLRTLVRSRFGKWSVDRRVQHAFARLEALRMVKTIWHIRTATDLLRFYHPTKVLVDNIPVAVETLDSFGRYPRHLVVGTVGQGKSILLRFLTAAEGGRGDRLPIFIELRRLAHHRSVSALIRSEMECLGLPPDEDMLQALMAEDRVSLLMDGFDEVPETARDTLVEWLQTYARRYPRTPMVVTSRPDCGLEVSPFFRIVDVKPLDSDEYKKVLFKLCESPDVAQKIVKDVERNGRLLGVLKTPLMVALLAFRYEADQSTPENIVSFYRDLFPLLIKRHDSTKPGFKRERRSTLSDSELHSAFLATSFLTRKLGMTTLTFAECARVASDALDDLGYEVDAEDVLNDLIDVSCLLIREGDEVKFVHKSIQEFSAAAFISSQPASLKPAFYERQLRADWSTWEQEIRFLRWLDGDDFLEMFLVPDARLLVQDMQSVRAGRVGREEVKALYEPFIFVPPKAERRALHRRRGSVRPNWNASMVGLSASAGRIAERLTARDFRSRGAGLSPIVSAALAETSASTYVENETRRIYASVASRLYEAERRIEKIRTRKKLFEI